MERTYFYPALAEALVDRGTDARSIENFGRLWDSITAGDRLPCPLCFTYAGRHSALKPLPEKGGKEPMRCEFCLAVFDCPLPGWLC